MNRRNRYIILAVIVAVMVVPLSARSHILKLKDGRILTGEFMSATKEVVKFLVEGETVQDFPVSDILSIHFSMASIGAQPQAKAEPVKILPGKVIRVRLAEEVSTANSSAGKRFFAVLDEDLVVDGMVLSEKGKRVFGRVRKVVKPKRSIDKAVIELVITDLTIIGKTQPVISDYFGVQNDGQGTVNTLGSAKALDATLPQLTDGKNVKVPVNTLIEFRITQPVTVRDVK